jgi:outer membrane cobalamin receptor
LGLNGDDTLTVRGAVFHSSLKDLIERQSLSATQFAFRNVPKAETFGAELSAAYEGNDWFGSAAVGHTKGENKTVNQPLLDVPPVKLNTVVGRKGSHAKGDWRVGWTAEIASGQTRVPPNDLLVSVSKGYMVNGVFASYTPKQKAFRNVTIGVNIDNMFDHNYRRVTSFIDETGFNARMNVKVRF